MEKSELAKLKAHFRRECAEGRFRITPQRVAIYEELARSSSHPSAEDIYLRVREKFPHISFDTVYRTLMTFTESGLIIMVEGHGGRKRFDGDTGKHYHFRCRRCGELFDFHHENWDELCVPPEIEKKFRVREIRVVLEGVCRKCPGAH